MSDTAPRETTASEFTRLNKPREIEEFLDTYLIRPMGYVLVLGLRHTPVTPNMVSGASVVAALGAAACLFHPTVRGALGVLLFMLLTSALDSADGQLARATNRRTEIGRFVDGFCDNLSFGAMYVAIAIILSAAVAGPMGVLAVVALTIAAALSHSAQSSLTDYERQLFLYYCKDGRAHEGELPERLDARRAEARAAGGSPLLVLFLWMQRNYSRQQRALVRSGDRLQRAYREAVAGDTGLRERFARRYRQHNVRRVRLWAIGGPNAHKVGVVAAAFLAALAHGHPLGLASFLVYDLALNIPLALLIRAQARADAQLLAELAAPAAPPRSA